MNLLVPGEWVPQVDQWRSHQPDMPNLSEAIRRLVEIGLEASSKGEGEAEAVSLRLSIGPKPRKPIRRQRSIPRGRLQIPMPEIMRQRPGIGSIVRQLIPRRMLKHVRVDWKR